MAPDFTIGQTVGNYRIVKLIDEGGMGRMFLVEHIYLHAYHAMKVLFNSDTAEIFLKEAQRLQTLEHPRIISIRDFGLHEGVPYMVMQLAETSLFGKWQKLSIQQVVELVIQVAAALAYAHERNIAHLDVKPGNILCDKDGRYLLSDFGLAHVISENFPVDIAGSIPYMSPEQIQGWPSLASDQYSLAVTIYQILTGTVPFTGTDTSVMDAHLYTPVDIAPLQRAEVPDLVSSVLLRALSKGPQDRFSDIMEFAGAFEDAVLQAQREAAYAAERVHSAICSNADCLYANRRGARFCSSCGWEVTKTSPKKAYLIRASSMQYGCKEYAEDAWYALSTREYDYDVHSCGHGFAPGTPCVPLEEQVIWQFSHSDLVLMVVTKQLVEEVSASGFDKAHSELAVLMRALMAHPSWAKKIVAVPIGKVDYRRLPFVESLTIVTQKFAHPWESLGNMGDSQYIHRRREVWKSNLLPKIVEKR